MSGFAAFVFMGLVFALLEIVPRAGIDLPGLRTSRARIRASLAAMFVFTGAAHFYATDAFVQSIPEFLPPRREAVYISGMAELAGAVGLLVPRLQRVAGIGLALMLLAVFPANINVAVNSLHIELFPREPVLQWLRLLLQPLYIGFALWATSPEPARAPRRAMAPVRV
jgi:uncharacterized membrane protein